MPFSYAQYAGNGSSTTFSVPFPYLLKAHVKLYTGFNILNGTYTSLLVDGTDYSWTSATQVQTTVAPANGVTLTVLRDTPDSSQLVPWQDGSNLIADDLNSADLQNLYVVQEQQDRNDAGITQSTSAITAANNAVAASNNAVATANAASAAVTGKLNKSGDTMTGALAMSANKITGVGTPTNPADAATKSYVDGFVSQTANVADDAIITAKVADGAITTTKLADGAVTSGKIADGTIVTADIGNLQVTGAKIADDTITSAKLSNVTVVTNAEQAASSPNDTSFFTTQAADSRYFRQDSSETINSGMPWSGSDSFIATTAAIDARIVDLVDDVGGFVPIASETSFPLSNPDVNSPDGAGTIISIKEVAATRTPVSGTVTIANGAGGNTVTITGCGSTVLAAGFGVLVETTATLHTYAFHRLVPKATEVTTVASISGNVTTVAGISGNVTTVATNNASIISVAANIADIQTVAADLNEPVSEIDTVATNIANVNTVGASIGSVNTVAGANASIGTVATNVASVNTVAGSIGNVNTNAANIASINTVAASDASITTCAANMAAITAAPTQAANAATSATAAANSATAASSLVTTITNLSYLLNWGLITEAAGTPSTDYGAL